MFTLRSAFWSCFGRSVKLSKLWAILQVKISIHWTLRENNYIKPGSKDGERYRVILSTESRYPEIAAEVETGIPNMLQRNDQLSVINGIITLSSSVILNLKTETVTTKLWTSCPSMLFSNPIIHYDVCSQCCRAAVGNERSIFGDVLTRQRKGKPSRSRNWKAKYIHSSEIDRFLISSMSSTHILHSFVYHDQVQMFLMSSKMYTLPIGVKICRCPQFISFLIFHIGIHDTTRDFNKTV